MSGYMRFEYRPAPNRSRITYAVQWLILANIAVFAGQLAADVLLGEIALRMNGTPFLRTPPGGWLINGWFYRGMLVPGLAFRPDQLLWGAVWQPLTYMFLHDGLLHLCMNMVVLFFFGPEVERILSTRQFLRFFLLCGGVGVLATFIPFAVWPNYTVSIVGASGAVMGVLVAFAMAAPEREILLFPIPLRVNARGMILVVIALNVLSAFLGDGVSVATHFGGMAMGYAYMKAAPGLRAWFERTRNRVWSRKEARDPLGDAVDNILKFRGRKRSK